MGSIVVALMRAASVSLAASLAMGRGGRTPHLMGEENFGLARSWGPAKIRPFTNGLPHI
jgi:hypothetical protein